MAAAAEAAAAGRAGAAYAWRPRSRRVRLSTGSHAPPAAWSPAHRHAGPAARHRLSGSRTYGPARPRLRPPAAAVPASESTPGGSKTAEVRARALEVELGEDAPRAPLRHVEAALGGRTEGTALREQDCITM